MSAVTAEQVKRIIDTDVSHDDVRDIYIPMGGVLADAIAVRATDEGITISDARDTAIRMLLAAHFTSVTRDVEAGSQIEIRVDTVYTRVAGGVGTRDMFGAGLKMTRFGSQAIALDPTGLLADISSDLPEATIDVVLLPDPAEEEGSST